MYIICCLQRVAANLSVEVINDFKRRTLACNIKFYWPLPPQPQSQPQSQSKKASNRLTLAVHLVAENSCKYNLRYPTCTAPNVPHFFAIEATANQVRHVIIRVSFFGIFVIHGALSVCQCLWT